MGEVDSSVFQLWYWTKLLRTCLENILYPPLEIILKVRNDEYTSPGFWFAVKGQSFQKSIFFNLHNFVSVFLNQIIFFFGVKIMKKNLKSAKIELSCNIKFLLPKNIGNKFYLRHWKFLLFMIKVCFDKYAVWRYNVKKWLLLRWSSADLCYQGGLLIFIKCKQ